MGRETFQHTGLIKVINCDSVKPLALRKGELFYEISSESFEIRAFDTKPISSLELPVDFPECCEYHRSTYRMLLDKLNRFPDCCDLHRRLATETWFDKRNYFYMPTKVLKTVAYTESCITECIERRSWFKEITDYITYAVKSFGQFPSGFGPPLGANEYLIALKARIESIDIDSVKKGQLQKFLEGEYAVEPSSKKDVVDLGQLIGIYNEWLETFPFELSHLRHLKTVFENRLPLVTGEPTTNMYTGVSCAKLLSKPEIYEFLKSTTLEIIKEINALKLYTDGELKDVGKVELDLMLAARKLEIQKLGKEGNPNSAYANILTDWLTGERKFIEELKPLLTQGYGSNSIIEAIVDGFRLLQSNDSNEPCLQNIRNNGQNKESAFRYWFKNFLVARFGNIPITVEEEKGIGRMDLKIHNDKKGTTVIEFKGWWNRDKNNTARQLCGYLTEFDADGFIIMINNLKSKDIGSAYKQLVIAPEMQYLADSWKEHQVANTSFSYFESQHLNSIKPKKIYHFIFNIYF
ncbi:hypothetical protein [Sphingobacterium suaedae]|uniref:Restriction endonuclease type IV Mrr domain-containing protein n=1 Tax=Sphingobacterium suaedae TaxID=1686402 RepID=A0ABW5KJH4_9SPHI